MKQNLDMISLYAWSDSSYVELRALWRNFFAFFLEYILEIEQKEIDEFINSCIIGEINETILNNDSHFLNKIYTITAELAIWLKISPELAVASIIEANPPTKIFKINIHNKKLKLEKMSSLWIKQLEEIKIIPEFQNYISNCQKNLLKIFDEIENLSENIASNLDNDDENLIAS